MPTSSLNFPFSVRTLTLSNIRILTHFFSRQKLMDLESLHCIHQLKKLIYSCIFPSDVSLLKLLKVTWIWSSSLTSTSMQSHPFLCSGNGCCHQPLLHAFTSHFVDKWFHYFLGYFSRRFFFWGQNRQTYVSSVYLFAYQKVIHCGLSFV